MRTLVPVQAAFGDYLRELRERTGLTLEQLAEKSGFSSPRLGAIERGEINLNLGTLLILAMSLDTTLQDLLSGIALKLRHPEIIQGRVIAFQGYRKSQQENRQKFRVEIPG